MLVVAVLFGIVVGRRLDTYHGKPTGFVLFGRSEAAYTHPPRGTVMSSADGYDGQFYYLLANDPLLLHDSTVASLRTTHEAFRLQRIAYPALAFALAAGQRSAVAWSLLAFNLLVVLAITAGFAFYARSRGWSPLWALAVGGIAGLLTGTMRDLSDPLAVASMLAGLLMWEQGRRWWAAAFLSAAVLAREPMVIAVAAIAVEAGVQWWRSRMEPGALKRIAREAWPVVLVPAAIFLVWQVYIDARYGGNAASTSVSFTPPLQGLIDEVNHALNAKEWLDQAWEIAYISLIVGGILAAIVLCWRRAIAPSLAALLFGISLLVLVFGDPFSYTRDSAPMFAALLLGGLRQRSRPALLVCVAATALTAVMPFAPWFRAA